MTNEEKEMLTGLDQAADRLRALRDALADIHARASATLNNGFPDDAPEALAGICKVAADALKHDADKTNETNTPDALPMSNAVGVGSYALLAVIGEAGWMSPTEPPNTARTVQVAWEDMSYGPNTLGFYDGVAETPDSGTRFWWTKWSGHWQPHKEGTVGAWRELSFAGLGG